MPPPVMPTPVSPLRTAISSLQEFSTDEEKSFYAALDALPNFDSPAAAPPPTNESHFRYTIDDEDWQWLSTAVATRTQQDIAEFAASEYQKIGLDDPELVRRAPHSASPSLCAPVVSGGCYHLDRGVPRGCASVVWTRSTVYTVDRRGPPAPLFSAPAPARRRPCGPSSPRVPD